MGWLPSITKRALKGIHRVSYAVRFSCVQLCSKICQMQWRGGEVVDWWSGKEVGRQEGEVAAG